MSAEQILTLLDSFWFETTILSDKNPSNFHSKVEEIFSQDTNLLLVPTPNLDVRFYSEQNLSIIGSVFSDSPSPNSVLTSSKLRTIPSEREFGEFSKETSSENHHQKEDVAYNKKKQSQSYRRRRRKSRSLSELEFKELKGFMDLGFVFSEEDKDSKLVSLIPGLQRLGKENDDAEEGEDEEYKKIDENVLSDHKPYLSEAWDAFDQRERKNPLVNWRVPDKGSEIDMKDNLKFWAHAVASIAR